MISPFVLHQPGSLPEALSVLAEHNGDTNVLAGGSELLLLLKLGLIKARHLVDIKKITELSRLEFDSESKTLHVGPLVTHRTLEKSELIRQRFPLLAEMQRELANVRIRNVGTLAGNLCFAEPHSDPAALLVAYDAFVILRSSDGERRVPIGDFFTDYYETVLRKNELMIDIQIPELDSNFLASYSRFCPSERPIVTIALLTLWDDGVCAEARLGLGCVGPMPLRVAEFEDRVRGKSAEELSVKADEFAAMAARSCEPLADLWGSPEYKRKVLKNLVRDALQYQCHGKTNNE
jgi:carbon-monoxide dehydrogenase medium subunit